MPDRYSVGVSCSLGIGPDAGGREWNEDNFLIVQGGRGRWRDHGSELDETLPDLGVLLAVADGMGGHARGDIASLAAVRALVRLARATIPDNPEDVLCRFIQHAHSKLHDAALTQGVGRMGTTLTTAWILGGKASWVQVGDSRLYLQRGEGLIQITRDQTRAELAQRDGRPPPRDPGALVQGFVYGSRGLGDDRKLRLDAGKDTGTFPLAVGDRLLLCSDGLHGVVPDAVLAELLRASDDPQHISERLIGRALALGSDDNITAVVLVVEELHQQTAPAPMADIVTLVPMD